MSDRFNTIRSFSYKYWLLNIIQMIERLAYWVVVLQMPIYIAQKDIPGGLHWEQTTKGMIYLWWALMQNAVPVLTGGFADRYGRRRILSLSFILIIIGYIILGSTRELPVFIAGVIILGIGSGMFKPTVQGAIADTLDRKNSSIGWGLYVMLINLAVFAGPPLSIYLKEISWSMVFYGSAIVFSLNFIVVMLLGKFNKPVTEVEYSGLKVLSKTFKGIFTPKIGLFVLIMSGFTIIYMQFYETLPNFIYDWSDTSMIATHLNLSDHFTMDTPRGLMVSYEWLYNINAGFVIIGVVLFSYLMKKIDLTKSITIGIIIATIGLFLSGLSMYGYILAAGMLIYTLGEMITNPRFTEYMGRIAPEGDKSLFMGYMSISWTIGLAGGGVIGGYVYKHLGEKANFALKYMNEHYPAQNVTIQNAFQKLTEISELSNTDATILLWNTYNPYYVWLPFFILGIASVIGLYFYRKRILE